ncbi:MAG: hypothetical protein JW904_10415 [Spirochaetales bacterium]|nr:hypothetical protein [Spirochaetales bacterium]
MSRKKIVITLALCVFVLMSHACQSLKLDFKTLYKDDTIDPYRSPREGILETVWENSSTLVLRAYIITHCAGAQITGSYEIKDNILTAYYSIRIGNEYSKSDCAHIVVYRIEHLEQKEYVIGLQQKK